MSLLMLKTKNLSWQDHTLNIEAMLAPLRSTLLMNKHKTLDTKFDQEKALYDRQRDACIKDFVVEKRLIERRRQKIINRKKEIMQEVRAQSALEHEKKTAAPPADNKERSLSAPSNGRLRPDGEGVATITSALPKLSLKHAPLFGANPLRPRLFLETGKTSNTITPPVETERSNPSPSNIFITGDGQRGGTSPAPSIQRLKTTKPVLDNRKSPHLTAPVISKSPKLSHHSTTTKLLTQETPRTDRSNNRGLPKRMPSVTFLGLLNNDDDTDDVTGTMVVEVKQKTVEDKVREFLRDLDAFNSRPPTACSDDVDEAASVLSSIRSRDRYKQPLVANRYHTLTLDKKLLEKAFDRYIEKRSHEDLLKAMKLAAKMKAHIRQARNTSLVPTMAAFKSSRTFLKILKRQQRKEQHGQTA